MNSQNQAIPPELSVEELNDLIVDSIQDIKGNNIVKLDLRELEDAPTDFFIIAEGDSNTQVNALANNIYGRLKKEGDLLPSHYEGQQNGLWILMDYFTRKIQIVMQRCRESNLRSSRHYSYLAKAQFMPSNLALMEANGQQLRPWVSLPLFPLEE